MSIEKHRNPNGTYDGAAVLGEVTGLGRPEMLRLFEEVKANSARLDACPLHTFGPAGGRRRTCTTCGGWADPLAVSWYERGLAHAAK